MNIIYVLGLARSGSTYFSKILTELFGAVSLGEIVTDIEIYSDKDKLEKYRAEKRRCICGEIPEECDFWSNVISDMQNKDMKSAHYKLLKTAHGMYPGSIIIDTSKTSKRLSEFYLNNHKISDLNVNVVVLNIIRHYAGQVASYQKYHSIEGTKGIEATMLCDAYTWLNKNRKNISFLEHSRFPSKTIMYEDLIFRQEEIKSEIKSFVYSSFGACKKAQPIMHEIGGNESFKTSSANNIRYDTSWMYDMKISLLSPLIAPVIYFNKKWHNRYQPGVVKKTVVSADHYTSTSPD